MKKLFRKIIRTKLVYFLVKVGAYCFLIPIYIVAFIINKLGNILLLLGDCLFFDFKAAKRRAKSIKQIV